MDICKSKLNLWFLVEIRWIFAFDLVCIWWVEFVSCYRFGTWFEIDWLLSAINESEGRSVLQSGSVVGGLIGFQSLCFESISAFDLEIIDWWTKSQLKKKSKLNWKYCFDEHSGFELKIDFGVLILSRLPWCRGCIIDMWLVELNSDGSKWVNWGSMAWSLGIKLVKIEFWNLIWSWSNSETSKSFDVNGFEDLILNEKLIVLISMGWSQGSKIGIGNNGIKNWCS